MDLQNITEEDLIRLLKQRYQYFDYPQEQQALVGFAKHLSSQNGQDELINAAVGSIAPFENVKSAALSKLEKATGLSRNDTLIDDAYNSFWKDKFSADDLKQPAEYWKQYFVPSKQKDFKPSKASMRDTEHPIENILKALQLAIGYRLP